jgi:hypothetical protein
VKKAEKIALGVAAALLLCCLLSLVLILFSDSSVATMKFFAELEKQSAATRALDKTFPFSPPADGLLREDRLGAFLDVCCAVKPAADAVDAYRKGSDAKSDKRGLLYKGAPVALEVDLLKAIAPALEAQRMGPSEFQWIANQLEYAKAYSADSRQAREMGRMREDLQRTAESPQLSRRQREKLKDQIRTLEPLAGPSAEANAALCKLFADRIAACSLGERSRIVLSDLPSLPGSTQTKVVVVNPRSSDPSPTAP